MRVTLSFKEAVFGCTKDLQIEHLEPCSRCGGSGKLLVEKAVKNTLEVRAELPESAAAPVEPGQPLGRLIVTAGDRTVAEVPLTAAEGVMRLSALQIWRGLVRVLCGQPSVSFSSPGTQKTAGPGS